MRYPTSLLFTLCMLVLAGCADPEPVDEPVVDDAETLPTGPVAWAYDGTTGPDEWGELSADYAECSEGQAQSPINIPIAAAEVEELDPLEIDYGPAELDLEDTGLGYKATPDGSQMLTVGADTYELLQFHAHTPSEHTIEGDSYPMEIHFVHQNDAGELAVIGIMVEEGDENTFYAPVLSALPNSSASVETLAALMPEDKDYFTYSGSLTTPPCSEGVRWIVLQDPIEMSAAQLAIFAEAHGVTNRPVQPLYDREVSAMED